MNVSLIKKNIDICYSPLSVFVVFHLLATNRIMKYAYDHSDAEDEQFDWTMSKMRKIDREVIGTSFTWPLNFLMWCFSMFICANFVTIFALVNFFWYVVGFYAQSFFDFVSNSLSICFREGPCINCRWSVSIIYHSVYCRKLEGFSIS